MLRIFDRIAFSASLLTAGVYPQEVEGDILELALSPTIFAVDDLGLGRMQFQATIRHPGVQRVPYGPRLLLGPAVH
jgi:hypothetical protein